MSAARIVFDGLAIAASSVTLVALWTWALQRPAAGPDQLEISRALGDELLDEPVVA